MSETTKAHHGEDAVWGTCWKADGLGLRLGLFAFGARRGGRWRPRQPASRHDRFSRASARFWRFSSRTCSAPNSSISAVLATVSLAEAGAHDTQITAGTLAVARRDCIEQARDRFAGVQKAQSLTARVEVSTLAQR